MYEAKSWNQFNEEMAVVKKLCSTDIEFYKCPTIVDDNKCKNRNRIKGKIVIKI